MDVVVTGSTASDQDVSGDHDGGGEDGYERVRAVRETRGGVEKGGSERRTEVRRVAKEIKAVMRIKARSGSEFV